MRRTITLRRAAAAVVLPLALTSLTACGGDDEPSGSSKAADPGVEEGEEIKPSTFIDSMQESFAGATTARVEMESTGEYGLSAVGDVDYSQNPPEMQMTMENEMLGGEISTVMVDGVMYMQMGDMSGGKYIKMDLSDSSGMLGQDLSSQMDPSQSLAQMEKAIKTVTYNGEESIEGEDLDHYTVLIDSAQMVGAEGAGASGMPGELTYEIWFDDDGLFRRTEMNMGEQAGTMTMKLSDWGKDVEIEAPPADQVTDMPEMPSMPATPKS